jgi:hypothetical protein
MSSTDEPKLTFVYPLPRRQQRFREIILYIADKCRDAEFFGAVKLNKILFYADRRAYLELGRSITGARYQHLEEGPAPVELVPLRREMIEAAQPLSRTVGISPTRKSDSCPSVSLT